MSTPLLQPVISPILVGRNEHLVALDVLAARLRAGSGITLLVSGEAGIGKSRLIAEARTRFAATSGARVVQGHCFEHDAGLPYAPIVDLLRGLMARQPDDLARMRAVSPELAVLLPELAGESRAPDDVPVDAGQDRRRVQDAALRAFAALAEDQPLLVVIEDIHWADDLSLELLQRLAQRAVELPLLLILSWREDEVSERLSHFLAQIDRGRLGTELRLQRLTARDVEFMLRAMFDQRHPIRQDFLRMIVNLTDGNPFFIEEVVTALIATGDIYRVHGGWSRKDLTDLRIPRSVVDAVQQRARGLSDTAGQLLNLAAVSGQRFDIAVIQELLSIDDETLLSAIRELIDARLIVDVSVEQLAFRHALTREAVYASLLARERRARHLALADAIERRHAETLDAFVADLSYHYHAAGAWAQCLTYARLAGERARSLFAPAAEIEHVDRALDAVAGLSIAPPRDLYRARALARATLGEFERAGDDHAVAFDLARRAGDREAEWQSLLDIGGLWSGLDYARAGLWFQQALDLARDIGEPSITAQTLVQLGNWQVNIERVDEAERSLTAALEIFEAANDRPRMAETIDLLGIVADLAGDVALMHQRLNRAIDLYRETENRRGLASTLATNACAAGSAVFDAAVVPLGLSLSEARSMAQEAVAISQDISWRAGEAYAWLNLSFVERQRGELGSAAIAAQAGTAIVEEIEHPEWMTLAWQASASLAFDQLALDRAQTDAERGFDLARQSGSSHFLHTAAGVLVSVCVANRDLHRGAAVSAAFDAVLPMRTIGQRRLWLARGELSLASRDAESALGIAERLLDSAINLTGEGDIPAIAKLRGDALAALGRDREAESAYRAAADGADARSMRLIAWQIHAALARLLHRARRLSDAEAAAESAGAMIDMLAATIADEGDAETFRARATAALPGRRRPTARSVSDTLTRRERDVALLVVRGLTNREIADTLFVGERTVETHVGNILAKLGFTSRAQIAAWVVEREGNREGGNRT